MNKTLIKISMGLNAFALLVQLYTIMNTYSLIFIGFSILFIIGHVYVIQSHYDLLKN